MKLRASALYVMAALLYVTEAHASGEPAVIYWVAGGGLAQVVVLIFLVTSPRFRATRFPAITGYALYLHVLWSWVWNSSQSPTLLGSALVLLPVLAVCVLVWMVSSATASEDR
jgi:hypothetical protein